MEIFGIKLRTLRQASGLTQEQLANRLDIVKASISGYEQDRIYPSIDILIKLCRFFNVSADYLLGLSDAKEVQISHLTDEQVYILTGIISQFEKLNSKTLNDN